MKKVRIITNFILIFITLLGQSLKATPIGDKGYIEIPTLNDYYDLSTIKWFFKNEDNLNFKNKVLDTSDWYLIPGIGS